MRKQSSKRILNQRPLNLPTKTLRTRSLLWVKPTVAVDQLSASVIAQVGTRRAYVDGTGRSFNLSHLRRNEAAQR